MTKVSTPSSSKKKGILDLLDRNLFFAQKTITNLRKKLDTLSEAQQEVLLLILKRAEEKQDALIQKLLEKDPDHFKKLEGIISKELKKLLQDKEHRSQEEDLLTMNALEQELEKI